MGSAKNYYTQEQWNVDLYGQIHNRVEMLEQEIEKRQASIAKGPQGKLRDAKHRGKYQYYLRSEKTETCGTYIKKKNVKLAISLAQKEYDEAFVEEALKELKLLKRYLSVVTQANIRNVYEKMSEGKRLLVRPVITDDESYVNQWLSEEYRPGYFEEGEPEYFTQKGERVRSKSEMIIANELLKYGVPYKYEYPITLSGYGDARPDFLCLNVRRRKEVILEHFGKMDDYRYVSKNIPKIDIYQKNGFYQGDNLIMSFETSQYPLDVRTVDLLIEKYLL